MLFGGLSNEQAILLVLAGFYCYEALVWLPDGATALIARWGRSYVPHGGRMFRVGDKGGFALSSLLPTASTLIAHECPLKLAPSGLLVESPPGQPEPLFHTYESLGELSVDHNLVLSANRPLCKLASPLACRSLAELLKKLTASLPSERERMLEDWIAESTDERRAAQRLENFWEATGSLRVLSVIFFALTLLLAGLTVGVQWSWLRMPTTFSVSLLLLSALWLAIIVGFSGAQSALYPGNSAFRRQRMFAFIVSPVCAMRAADLLSRDLMAGLHPLAVAQACCPRREFRPIARRSLLQLMNPVARTECDEAADVRQWYDRRMLAALTGLIVRAGEHPQALVAPPEPLGADASAYCPRCEMQYAGQPSLCNVCGVPLQSFEAALV